MAQRFYRNGIHQHIVNTNGLHEVYDIHDEDLGHLIEFVYPDLVEDGVYIDAVGLSFRGVIVDYHGLDDTNSYSLIDAPDWVSIESDGLHIIEEPTEGEHDFTLRITSSSHIVDQPIQIIV